MVSSEPKTASAADFSNQPALRSGASNGRTLVTYTRTSGNDADARFSFGVHTPAQAGDYPFQTNQTYSDNSTVRWDGDSGSDTPAPVLKVT